MPLSAFVTFKMLSIIKMSLQILSEYRRRGKTASPLQVWQMMWHTLMYLGSIALMTCCFFSANTTGSFNRRCLSCNLSCGYVSGSFSPDANYFLLNCKGLMLFLCKTSVHILSYVKDFFNRFFFNSKVFFTRIIYFTHRDLKKVFVEELQAMNQTN